MTMGSVERKVWCCGVAVCAVLFGLAASADAQTFNSGSTGADGALDLTGTASGTTVEFDPVALNINVKKDNVFNFTTITIPAGVTLKLTVKKMPNSPVYFLATGVVNIAGTLDLSGQNGYAYTSVRGNRIPSLPGPGGFAGGIGGSNNASSPISSQNGLGPLGGAGSGTASWSGSYPTVLYGDGGKASATKFLVPLVGGSGGGGGLDSNYENWGAGGGAGGGAILIASSASVTLASTGKILANGGLGGRGTDYVYNGAPCLWAGGSGAGGSVRLVAPAIGGTGTIQTSGGGSYGGYCPEMAGSNGLVRIESFSYTGSFSISAAGTTLGSPINSYVPASVNPPSIAVTSVGGKPISNPTGSFSPADVTINSSGPIAIQIHATGIPVGTVLKVQLFSLEGPDQTIDTTPLAGTLQDSTSTATVTLPAGFTRGYARAKW